MKMKMNYINSNNTQSNNHNRVQSIIKDYKDTGKIENLFKDQMDSQGETFKKRLQEKRKKIALSTSDTTEQIDTMVNQTNLETSNRRKQRQLEPLAVDNPRYPKRLEFYSPGFADRQ